MEHFAFVSFLWVTLELACGATLQHSVSSGVLRVLKRAALSKGDIDTILSEHNKYRGGVSPGATNMMKMYWSNDIARHAQQYADSCPDGHDTGAERKEGAGLGIAVGQNLAWGYKTWPEAIKGWYDEVNNFKMGVGSHNGGMVGHYTQLVRDHATHIGCGFKNCAGKTMPTHFVCNYAYAQSDFTNPYKAGTSCGDCKGHCKNNLCDCGDVVCKNGGSMDPSSCKCKCSPPFTGAQCTDTDCKPDPDYCGQPQPYGYEKSHCAMFSNVPEECPKLCGIC